jgi:predicted nuclease of predicted toxin-antitoxin system
LFLDEGFSAPSVAERLTTAGFTVQRFPEWFRDETGQPLRNVRDSEVIRFCNKHGWLLVTRDHEMKNMHREEIRKSSVAILATAHNSAKDQGEWVAAIINLKTRILREFRKRERPWFAVFSREANITSIHTIR